MSRMEKRKKKRRNYTVFLLLLIVIAFLLFGYWKHSQEQMEIKDKETGTALDESGKPENPSNEKRDNMDSNGKGNQKTPLGKDQGEDILIAGEIPDSTLPSRGKDKSIRGIPDPVDTRLKDDGDLLMIVSKRHAVSKDFVPKDLVVIDNKYGSYPNMQLRKNAYDAYKKLYQDAKAKGFDFKLCSTYRGYQTQKGLYRNYVDHWGREKANIRSSYPGRSEHHTGLAIDITSASMGWALSQDFAEYPDGEWVNKNCQNYGFILRYPKGKTHITGYDYEPWHFRYVGVEVAKEIMEKGLTLEEYKKECPE